MWTLPQQPSTHGRPHRRCECLSQLAHPSGGWKVRKRIPEDIREQYARAYGVAREATKTWPASTKEAAVKKEYAEWLADIEGRIEALRAASRWHRYFPQQAGRNGAGGRMVRLVYSAGMRKTLWSCVDHGGTEVNEAFQDASTEEDLHLSRLRQNMGAGRGGPRSCATCPSGYL